MQAPLRIGLCGGLVVHHGRRRIEDELSGRQGRELFTYLVLNRSRSVSRDELMALLWPERPPRSPEAALNTILARLRRALGRSILAPRAQLALELPPDSWIDVEAAAAVAARTASMLADGRFEEAVEAAASAVEIVSARLLPEIQHAWIDQWRAEVEDVHSRLLALIARAGLALGGARLTDAERAARRLIEREPFRESGYGLLMEIQQARGDVAEALLVYERVRTLLRDELGIPPSASLAALHEKLLRVDAARRPQRAPGTAGRGEVACSIPLPSVLARTSERRLVGREQELAALLELWHALGADDRRVIAVVGEPGIGKTMLSARLAREAHENGAVVLCGHAQEEALVPYAPLVEALRHYVVHTSAETLEHGLRTHLDSLHSLVPELANHRAERPASQEDPRLHRMRLYQAFAAWVDQAASRQPVLLVLEDMQWADADTLLVIRQLLREPVQQPVVALLTYRDTEVGVEHPLSRLLSDLRRDVGVSRVVLGGLGDEEIAELLEMGTGPSRELIRLLREHTDGNPFFVEEIVRSLREKDSNDGGRLSPGAAPLLPEGIQDVIQDRLRRLDQPVRDALTAAAVLGNDFGLESLEAIIDGEASDEIDTAVRAGLIEDSPDGAHYRFRHGLTREAIYHSIGRSRRAQLHVRAARALEQRVNMVQFEPAELAHHLIESGRSDEADAAIAYSHEAAARAGAAHAYEDAAEHYRHAIDVLERHRPREEKHRCELLLGLGKVCWQGGGPRARVIFEQAVSLARGLPEHSQFAEATLGLGGRFYVPTGQADEPYVHLLEEALETVGSDASLRTRVLARLGEHLIFVDSAKALRLSEEALAGARRSDDPLLLASTLLSRHATLLHIEHLDERKRLASEQVDLARRHELRELEALGCHWLLYDLFELGDVSAAADAVCRLERLAGELDQPLYRHSSLVWRRVLKALSGDFARAAQLAHEALNLARGAEGEAASRHFLTEQLAVVRDQGGSERVLQAVRLRALGGDPLWSAAVRLLELDDDDPPVGEPIGNDLLPAPIPDLPRDAFWLTILAWLAESAARTGDPERVALLHELLLPYADRCVQLTFSGSFGSVHRYLGLLAGRLGRSRQAAEHLDEAVRRHAEIPAPALEARARYDYAGELLAGRAGGSTHDATAMVERARELAEACGATRISERLRGLMPAATV